MKTKKIIFYIFSILMTLLCLVSFGILSYNIFRLGVIPNKYLITFYLVSILIILLIVFNIFRDSKKVTKIISFIFISIISIGFTFITYYFDSTYNFIKNMRVKDETLMYSVIVLNNSNYNELNDLTDKNISYLNDDYTVSINDSLNKKISYNQILAKDTSNLYDDLLKSKIDAIVLEESYLLLINEEVEGFSDNTKVIYTFKVKVKAHNESENKKIEVSKEPFIIYISGIDQYGNVNSVRGRSDVNQLLIVNPKTNHILIVNTPRDYYVQLAGTTGLRDKLTHAGIYGIDKSIDTIENIYEIDVDNYIRINFNTLIKVVDVIGGIDIYSDKSFIPWTNRSVRVQEGWNHFNGKEALAYSRERKTYVDGDFHRGRNQQQVMEAIITKLTTSTTLLSKYNSILNSLDGSFQTDIETTTITSFIKYQLDKMPSWKIDTIGANGYSSWGHTYSMPSYLLWVMEPDWDSIKNIKNEINNVLSEE